MGTYRVCVCFTRRFRATEKEPPSDVREAFTKYAAGGTHMTAEQLRRFLVEVQCDGGATVADAERIVEQVLQRRHHITQFIRNTLTLDDFHHYLFSADLNPPIRSQVHQDMTAPMSHYFIYTGHNSYLTGNQLSSDCSDVPIIRSLKRGVRALELDVWPNSANDNIHVLHGRTLTTPVELIKCLKAIKEHAFCASPYPLIITLEDHLNPRLREKAAQMMTQTFGDMLYYPDAECLRKFPSPEDLKYRIIISTRPPKEYLESKSAEATRSNSLKGSNPLKGNDSSSSSDDDDVWGKESSEPTDDQEDVKSEGDLSNHNLDGEDNDSFDQDSRLSGASAYTRLIAIHAGTRKGSLKKLLKFDDDEKFRRLSLNEQLVEKAAASHGTDVVRFTQKNLLRVYPKYTRVDSSNFKPHIGWMHGAQMVAFNMQGYGRSLWLMHGMFSANGGCGYVKKPDFLMTTNSQGEVFNPKVKLPVKKTLKVKVYMGDGWNLDFKKTHFDAYSPPDFYVKVGIGGVAADRLKLKTKIREDDWAPVWNEEFTFPLTIPELALLRVEVREYNITEKNHFGGQTCLPVPELRPGIYAVPLMNRKGDKFNSVRLLMRFQFV